jgi:hypothetical protein
MNIKKIILVLCLSLFSVMTYAQVENFSGPRVGVTYMTPGSMIDNLQEWDNVGEIRPYFFQFGWQYETRFMDVGGTAGIVELIGLVGGFEQGLFLPSVSSLIGLRTSKGFEFALGPNVSLAGAGMVFGAGFNFKKGGINFPVNIAFVPGRSKRESSRDEMTGLEDVQFVDTGHRISIVVGFNASKN